VFIFSLSVHLRRQLNPRGAELTLPLTPFPGSLLNTMEMDENVSLKQTANTHKK
jgi:hypothetical protein